MVRRIVTRQQRLAAACALGLLAVTTSVRALDPSARKLAERYENLLRSNPLQEAAFDRLWQIYDEQGEASLLTARGREDKSLPPILAARLLERAGHREEALRVLQPVAEKDPGAATLLASWWKADGDPRKAAEFQEKTGRALARADLLLAAAEDWTAAGDPARARQCQETALSLEPQNLSLHERLAAINEAEGAPRQALIHWQAIADRGTPAQRLTALEKIEAIHESLGQWQEALAAQEALLSLLGPRHWKARESREKLLRLAREAGQLEELESRWIREQRYRDLAALHASEKKAEESLIALSQALQAAPGDEDLLREIARQNLELARLPEAGKALDQLIKLRPADEETIYLRAEIAALTGRPEEAERMVEAFAQTKAGDPAALERKTDFYRRLHLHAALERSLAQSSNPADHEALAQHYLDRHQPAEARRVLEEMPATSQTGPEAAVEALRFARMLRQAGQTEEALSWARKAAERDPGQTEAVELQADILLSLGRKKEVETLITQSLRSTVPPSAEADRRLYSTLRDALTGTLTVSDGFTMRMALDQLTEQARTRKSEQDWLRLSRWRQWSGDVTGGRAALEEGLKHSPRSTLLVEALADHLGVNGETWAAIQEWENLAGIDPDRSAEAQRRIGLLRLNQKAPDEAVAIFRQVQQGQPRDWRAMADLADAQQQAGEWFDALDSWLAAEKLAPPEARRNLRAAILTAAAHLQLKDRGLDFLEQACASEKDPSARHELARQAAAFAKEQDVVEAWRNRLTRRALASPGDVFWPTAQALLLQEEGRLDEARQAMRKLLDQQPNPRLSETLLKLAEQSGDFAEAARLTTGETSEAAMKRALYLERSGGDAGPAWEILATRYARDPGVLKAAADFQDRRGEPARAEQLLRQMGTLDTASPQTWLKLGRLALARGDRARALDDFTQVLATTVPSQGQALDLLPPPRFQSAELSEKSADFLGGLPQESDTEGCRLLAIREIGRLIFNTRNKEDWAGVFTHPTERIWAFQACGLGGETIREIRSSGILKPDDEKLWRTFSAIALEEGEAGVLAEIANEFPWYSNLRWKSVAAALALLGSKNAPAPDDVALLVRSAPAIQRWELLRGVAKSGNPALACELAGQMPWNLPPPLTTEAWMELADWKLKLKDTPAARRAYDEAIRSSPPTHSYAQPLYEAMRARWLLTPEPERQEFRAATLAELKKKQSLATEIAGAALLAGLAGDYAEAERQFQALAETLGTGEDGDFTGTSEHGSLKLAQWHLPRLSRALLRANIHRDPALASLQKDPLPERAKSLFIASKLLECPLNETPYLLNEWIARGASQDAILAVIRQLSATGQAEKATLLAQRLCAMEPAGSGILMGILTLTPEPRLTATLDAYVRRMLASPSFLTAKQPLASAAVRLASVYLQNAQPQAALGLLDLAAQADGPSTMLLMLRGQALRQLGRFREALAQYEKADPVLRNNPACALEMAQLQGRLGQEQKAREILEPFLQPGHPQQVNAAQQLKELLPALADEALAQRVTAILDALALPSAAYNEDLETIRQQMAKLDFQYSDPAQRFQAGLQFLATHPSLPDEFRDGELQRLKRLAADDAARETHLYTLRRNLAQVAGRTPQFQADLRKEWDQGRGSYRAGEFLLNMALAQPMNFDLTALLDEYLTDRNYRPEAWRLLADRLLVLDQVSLAEKVLTALRQREGSTTASDLLWLEVCWRQGRPDREKLDALEQISLLEPARHLDLARYYLRLGLANDASRHLKAAMDGDANVRAEMLGEVSKQLIIRGHLAEAGSLFRQIADSSSIRASPPLLAAYLEATGRLSSFDPAVNEFQLPAPAFSQLRGEVLSRMLANGGTGWGWIEKNPRLLDDQEIRDLFQEWESQDWARSAKLWQGALGGDARWETRQAAALFYLRYATTLSGSSALAQLKIAHTLDAGNLPVARAYFEALKKAGQSSAASKALRQSIEAYGKPEDRQVLRQLENPPSAASLPRRP